MSLRFGLLWQFRNPAYARMPWEDVYGSQLELIAESETLGYDHAWLTEHHFVDDGCSPSALPIAAAIAARTTRIRIGTFLILLPLHHPVGIAEDAATIDLISRGRFDLGVGLGFRVAEFDDQGIPRAARGARMEESLEIVSRLLDGETLTYDGRFVKLRNIRISPPPLQQPRPPIWAGGVVPKAIDRAARMGFHFLNGAPAELCNVYDDALRKYGRDPQDYNIASQRVVFVAPSREQAWEIAAPSLHHTASLYKEWFAEANDAPDYEHAKIEIPSVDEIKNAQAFDYFGESAMVGTPADVIEQLEDFLARGRMTHLVCALPMPGVAPEEIRSSMRLFAQDVIPHFRRS